MGQSVVALAVEGVPVVQLRESTSAQSNVAIGRTGSIG
jgi:hypothetical protein